MCLINHVALTYNLLYYERKKNYNVILLLNLYPSSMQSFGNHKNKHYILKHCFNLTKGFGGERLSWYSFLSLIIKAKEDINFYTYEVHLQIVKTLKGQILLDLKR